VSQLLIQQYLNNLQDLRKVSGTRRENVVREAFKDLLKDWGRSHDLVFVPEYEITTAAKERRYVDGALLHSLRMPFGYWEAKDEKDDLDAEIDIKLKRGYPQDNIIFEDSTQAVLIQNRDEVIRCPVDDVASLEKLLDLFFGYERLEIGEFRRAVEQFKVDLPAVLQALREMIEKAHKDQPTFRRAAKSFLDHAHQAINPNLTEADVREMLIQHVLTEDIFSKVFGEDDFHRQNNVAKALYALEATFFTGDLKKRTLRGLDPYYTAIRAAAAQIGSHHEKQAFLKVIYENFYKEYNAKAADRLGVVYTPNEIVRFMIESADWLCEKHFSRNLIDPQVEILDPAAGTGTFICELLEHFRGQGKKLKHKYLEELHANEVAILPYYVANLNIEATYAAITGEYAEFPNLCFVDTLDNVAGLRKYAGHQDSLFGSVSEENVERIRRQNRRKISVIIGNPPYNANQLNENENNKNREYPAIDKRLKETYIEASGAQKTKLYDMYARFVRWASDRIEHDGIVAFVSNSSFIDARTFDGFRKIISQDFNEIWVIDLKGNARTSGERRRREGGNVFADQIRVGIAVYFCVRKKNARGCRIYYDVVRDYASAEEKVAFLTARSMSERSFGELQPDEMNNWINQPSSDFDSLLPVANKSVKSTSNPSQEMALFKLFSLGISTNRDDWVYDDDRGALTTKVRCLVAGYEAQPRDREFGTQIKWSRNLKRRFAQGRHEPFDAKRIVTAQYRPFRERWLYDSDLYIDESGSKTEMFPVASANASICFSDAGSRTAYCVLAVRGIADLHFGSSIDAYQQVPRYRFQAGSRIDNITDWALDQFRKHYHGRQQARERLIDKEAIFHYVYGVLHDPIYRERYALNLLRAFPRIPFYSDFWSWAAWGKELLALHLGYDKVAPTPLKRADRSDQRAKESGTLPKVLLKAEKEEGRINIDSETSLAGIPSGAWGYNLGTRCALEWILDQYKEKKPKDPTIREKFNTYRFADHKEKVIDLLARVTTVSVRTVEIMNAMRAAPR
jgi:predicted helicase